MRGLGNINQSMEPNTPYGKEIKQKLWIFLIVYSATMLIQILVMGGEGIMNLLFCLFLYCGINAMDPCMLSFFVFITIFTIFEIVTMLGTLIQHGKSLFDSKIALVTIMMMVSFVVHLVGYYFVYEGYKEFKADRKESGGGIGMGGVDYTNLTAGMNMGGGNDNQGQGGNAGNNGGGGTEFRAFQGQGVAIG